jgi:hypothetical protein
MSKVIDRIKANAEQLADIRAEVNAIEAAAKVQVDALKVKRDELQAALIAELKKEGLASIKTRAGDSYILTKRKGVNIINEALAMQWAVDNQAVSIDRRLVASRLSKAEELPLGFEMVETEFISVRGAKASKDE